MLTKLTAKAAINVYSPAPLQAQASDDNLYRSSWVSEPCFVERDTTIEFFNFIYWCVSRSPRSISPNLDAHAKMISMDEQHYSSKEKCVSLCRLLLEV